MRKIDENKKLAITQAVFQITQEVGLAGLSIAKVAKLAEVSPATIYIYYKDKTDMLGQILMEVKDTLDAGQETAILSAADPIEQFKNFLDYFIHQCIQYPLEAVFMRAALENPAEISELALAYSEQKAEVIQALYERLLASGKIKAYAPNLLLAWSATGISTILMQHFREKTSVSEQEIKQMIELSIDAISLH